MSLSGSDSNVDLTSNTGPEAIRVCTALTVVCTLFVGLRIGARRIKSALLGADDYTIIASLFIIYGLLAIIIISVNNGMGQNVGVVVTTIPNGVTNVLKMLMACEIMYATALAVIKISILLMYHRIFPTTDFQIPAMALGIIVVSWWIAVVLLVIFQCSPIALAYDKSLTGHCINTNHLFIGNAVPNIVTDIAILVLPARAVWQLQINFRQKFIITGIFLMGGLVVVISLIRLVSLFQLSTATSSPEANITAILQPPWIWTTVEPCVGIISACLPTLRPLAVHGFARTPKNIAADPTKLKSTNTSSRKVAWPSSFTKVKGDDGTGSFELLNNSRETVGGLTPHGYKTERVSKVTTAEDPATELRELPNGITVKRDLVWEER